MPRFANVFQRHCVQAMCFMGRRFYTSIREATGIAARPLFCLSSLQLPCHTA